MLPVFGGVLMTLNARKAYLFGDFELGVTARVLTRKGERVHLGSKAFDVLTCLVMRAGEIVTKDELLKTVWPESFVEEGNLTQQISALRRALGDCSGYITTIPGKGYQFTADVQIEALAKPSPENQTEEVPVPKVREGTGLFIVESPIRTVNQILTAPADETEEDARPSTEPVVDQSAEKPRKGIHTTSLSPPDARGRKGRMWLAGATAAVLLSVTAYFIRASLRRPPFEHFTIEKLAFSLNVPVTAISPDGAYLAFVRQDSSGAETLWVHHIATGSERPVLQNAAFVYVHATFSPDGGFIYFQVDPRGVMPIFATRSDVYRIPILGGQPQQIAQGADAPIRFIDQGRRLCLYRENHPANYEFVSAALDGGDEKVLFTGKPPYPLAAACAPDGKRAAVEDSAGNVEVLEFASGSGRTLSSSSSVGGLLSTLCWAPDGRGMFGVISNERSPFSYQIVFLSYPDGRLRQIVNDLGEYRDISLTANADIIATRQSERNAQFEDISLKDHARVKDYPVADLMWFSWLDGSRIIESDRESNIKDVDLTEGTATTLNLSRDHSFAMPSPCGATAFVARGVEPDGERRIYKMNLDGSGATQITHGPRNLLPECTSDGKWLFYVENRDPANPALMRMPLAGGEAQKVAETEGFNVSPDGKLVANNPGENGSKQICIFFTDTLQQKQCLPLPADASDWITFSADSKSIYFVRQTRKEATIWRQPLDGSPAVLIASLPGKFVYWLRASPDGTRLGLNTMVRQYRPVLLREIR